MSNDYHCSQRAREAYMTHLNKKAPPRIMERYQQLLDHYKAAIMQVRGKKEAETVSNGGEKPIKSKLISLDVQMTILETKLALYQLKRS